MFIEASVFYEYPAPANSTLSDLSPFWFEEVGVQTYVGDEHKLYTIAGPRHQYIKHNGMNTRSPEVKEDIIFLVLRMLQDDPV